MRNKVSEKTKVLSISVIAVGTLMAIAGSVIFQGNTLVVKDETLSPPSEEATQPASAKNALTAQDEVAALPPVGEILRYNQLDLLEQYLLGGGDPNARVAWGRTMGRSGTLLERAISGRKEQAALMLLQSGAEYGNSNFSVFEAATEGGLTEVIDYLLEEGHPDVPDHFGLATLALGGYYDTVEMILPRIDQSVPGMDDVLKRAAIFAIAGRQMDVARLLLTNLGEPSSEMLSDLLLQAQFRGTSPGIVKLLLELGADPQVVNERFVGTSATPIDLALRWYRYAPRGDDEALQNLPAIQEQRIGSNEAHVREIQFVIHELWSAGGQSSEDIDIDEIAVDGLTLLNELTSSDREKLVMAADFGFYEVVGTLLEGPGAIEFDQETLRHATITAIAANYYDIARLLLDNGAPPQGGVLHAAVQLNTPGLIRELLTKGGDVDEIVDGRTVASAWLESGRYGTNERVLEELIVAGADVCWLFEELPLRSVDGFQLSSLYSTASHCL